MPRVPERWADVKAGFVHRGARRACRPRTQRWSGWVVEEVVVVGDLRGQVKARGVDRDQTAIALGLPPAYSKSTRDRQGH